MTKMIIQTQYQQKNNISKIRLVGMRSMKESFERVEELQTDWIQRLTGTML